MVDLTAGYEEQLQQLYTHFQVIHEARYAIAAMCALQLFEWLLLLDAEVYLIHRSTHRLSAINISYLLCRYYPALLWIFLMWGIVGDHPKELCLKATRPLNAFLAPCQFTSQGVMMMRAYAFTARNRRILILLCSCYVVVIGINIWVFCVKIEIPTPFWMIVKEAGCFTNYGKGVMGVRIGFTIMAATLMDFISLTVVVIYCYRTHARDVSLGRYFVNQGLIAFAVVCGTNLFSAVLYFKPPIFQGSIGLPLMLVVPNLVACRVILQLRQYCQPPSVSELSARTSRVVRGAFEQRNPDAWTIN